MPADELIISIDKAFWPKGAARGLMPLLRSLGDKHGNLVIAAVPNKHIMVKGPDKGIAAVKPELRALIEEHFPDAPIPPELGGSAGDAAPPPAPEPKASPKSSPKSKPVKKEEPKAAEPAKSGGLLSMFSSKTAAAKAGKASEPIGKPVTGRKHHVSSVPAALLWECTRNNSSFIRNPYRTHKVPFSAEPCNLLAMHSAKFSGIASTQAFDVRPGHAKGAKRETIELVQSHATNSRLLRPPRATVTTGLSKCAKMGLRKINTEMSGRYYRKNLQEIAELKYTKVKKSLKKKKINVKSRRNKKSD